MNYIKKIKSLGFKKIEPIVICRYEYERVGSQWIHGYYIKTLREFEKENKDISLLSRKKYSYPRALSQYVARIQSYMMNVSESVSLYIIIVGNEFTFVMNNDSIPDEELYGKIHINKTSVLIKDEQLNNDFWKKCLNCLGKDIRREMTLKEIMKFK